MKSTIIFLFLAGCVSKQIYLKQLDEQRNEIEQLQKNREKQTAELKNRLEQLQQIKNKQILQLKKMIFRVSHKECKTEPPTQQQKEYNNIKTICIEDNGIETCIDFLVEEIK